MTKHVEMTCLVFGNNFLSNKPIKQVSFKRISDIVNFISLQFSILCIFLFFNVVTRNVVECQILLT